MECNFEKDDINHIYCRHFSHLHQVICELNLKVRLCPIQIPAFVTLLLLQELN